MPSAWLLLGAWRRGAAIAQVAGFSARPATLEASPSWKGIIQGAQQHGAGLIVVGTHRRHGLVGSVASAVAEHADVPVLIVHQPA